MLESELFREAVKPGETMSPAESLQRPENHAAEAPAPTTAPSVARTVLGASTRGPEAAAPAPKALLFFAHQDDEVIALGGRLRRFRDARVVHATDGAPRDKRDSRDHGFATLEAYREARAREVAAALRLAGIQTPAECLGFPDQEAGLHLRELANGVARLLLDFQPEVIFTHPYEGGHPDHDACAFAVARAVEISLDREGFAPLVIEAAFYHAGPQGFEAGTFLPRQDVKAEAEFPLSPAELERKQALLGCFTSQRETLRNFPLEYERYRIAPRYDFTQPPHTGRVLYDHYSWGMTCARFVQLATEALACP